MSLERTTQYQNPSYNWMVAFDTAVNELNTGALKFALVDTCSMYPYIPLPLSVESAQSNAGDVIVVVEPLTGEGVIGMLGAVVSIRSVHVLDHAL